MPDNTQKSSILENANTRYFNVDLSGGALNITIVNDPNDDKFSTLHDYTMILTPSTVDGKIASWGISGSLAKKLNMTGF
jgi:hypothetical protein